MGATTNNDSLATFQAATEVIYGSGAVGRMGELAHELAATKLLVVTDQGVSRAGITARVVAGLVGAGIEVVVFDAVEPNPSIQTVEKALALYRDAACEGVVAVGGGSPIDAAKAVATLATNSGEFYAYVGVGKIVEPLAPLLAVPTTANPKIGPQLSSTPVVTSTSTSG